MDSDVRLVTAVLASASASASALMKIVVVRFVDANTDTVLIADVNFFDDQREDVAFRCRHRHSTDVNETYKNLLKKLTST